MSIQMIGDRGDWKKIPQDSDLIDKLNREADKQPKSPIPTTQPAPQAHPSAPANVSSAQDYWSILVNYKNRICTIDLAKSLLDNGSAKTQVDWAEYRKLAEPKGEFYTGDMPLYFSVLLAFSKANGKDAEEAKEFLKSQMRTRWLITLTRIKYNLKGSDEVIHNFGTNQEYNVQTKFVGREEWIKNSKDTSYLEALLGTKDIPQINSVFQAINGTDAYIYRVSSKPKKTDEYVARFDANTGGANLSCGRGPDYSYASLGVRIASVASRSAK